ncbi:hypothetical protein Rhopal_007310-T1 [Rhodotorula paludigena]|uniref:Uncharacterized protein n=1 Tax=Rhodotorula paludigena TaxID=86838 RepID=A0AAV5GPD9_9BASI|nr:hypothetical protein Rhopal_007310-T1 [Rhodotorula paludigena]
MPEVLRFLTFVQRSHRRLSLRYSIGALDNLRLIGFKSLIVGTNTDALLSQAKGSSHWHMVLLQGHGVAVPPAPYIDLWKDAPPGLTDTILHMLPLAFCAWLESNKRFVAFDCKGTPLVRINDANRGPGVFSLNTIIFGPTREGEAV